MNNFNDKYTIRDFIDKNKWSNVYIGVNNETGETIILNMLINVGPNDENLINFKEEVNLLKEINSPNLTSINNISTYMNKDKTYYYIESEYFEGLTLKELIDNNEINKNQYIEIIREVIKGIIELNHKNINYKNLSEEDIIINEEGMVKVNTLSFINNHQGHINCTDVNFKKFNEAEDVYVIGKILCKIFTGKDYYDIDNNENLDEDLIEILEKSTYKKYISKYKYNNLNEFLNDIISYLGCEELPYKDVINYEKINNNNQNNNPNKHKINKYITLAIGLIVLMGGTLLGANMLNKINTSKNTAQVSETTTKEDLDKTNNNGNTNEQNTESNKNTTSNISSNNTNEETDNNKINNENNENTSIDDDKNTDNSDDKNTENYDKENDDKVESETDQKEDSEKEDSKEEEDSTEEDSKDDESDEQEPDTDQKPDTDNDNNESDTVENEENQVNQDNENKSNTQNNESKNNNQGENNENQE